MSLSASWLWPRVAALFLWRSGRSTGALTLMVTLSVAALIFLSALAVGVNDAMIRNSVRLYAGHISGADLPPALDPSSLQAPGVAAVLKRRSCTGVLSYGRKAVTVRLTGVDPTLETRHTALGKKVAAGRTPKPGEQGLLLGQALASDLGVGPGDAVTFRSEGLEGPVRFTVSGVYRTGIDALDRVLAFCPASAYPGQGKRWSAAVFLHSGVDPDTVIRRYEERFSQKYTFLSWRQAMPDLTQLIELEYLSMGVVMVLVFAIVSLGIACAFVIYILKGLRQYGIMKAMGVGAVQMAFLVCMEVLILNGTACLLGTLAGVAGVWTLNLAGGLDLGAFTSHNRYFVVSGVIYPRLTPFSLCLPPALAACFGLMAAAWPVSVVLRRRASEILRSF